MRQRLCSDERRGTLRYLALSILLASSCMKMPSTTAQATGDAQVRLEKGLAAHLGVDDSIGDLLKHPAFAGFSRLILPWDDRGYDETMRLRAIGSLLPYHSHVDPEVVVSSLNRMIDEARGGRTVFYDIYTSPQKQAEPPRENTGLFFLRGKPGAPFAVIAPGGGFAYVGSVHEGFPYAVEISNRGFNAFVLKYRAGHGEPAATEDRRGPLLHLSKRGLSGCQHRRLFFVGQLRGRKDGGGDRVPWHHTVWRFRRSQAIGCGAGVHRSFESRCQRTSHLCCRR